MSAPTAAPLVPVRGRARARLVGAGRPREPGAAGVGRVPRDRRRGRPGRPDPARRLERQGRLRAPRVVAGQPVPPPDARRGRGRRRRRRPRLVRPPVGDLRPGRPQRGRGRAALRLAPRDAVLAALPRHATTSRTSSAPRTQSGSGVVRCVRCSARCRWRRWSPPRRTSWRCTPSTWHRPVRRPPSATLLSAGCRRPRRHHRSAGRPLRAPRGGGLRLAGGRLGVLGRARRLDAPSSCPWCRAAGRRCRAAQPTCSTPRPAGARSRRCWPAATCGCTTSPGCSRWHRSSRRCRACPGGSALRTAVRNVRGISRLVRRLPGLP